ncbi:hypothetical protein B0T24DRAFT_186886 [Lasiosphaeria ovina]|uniref:Uncharacterized protein n=1 Tax=Lasiosphaeria ovina TaxID=92902 RepID=A0AAE0NEV6_9PEZI|nr:hypothetical protein B0T24DRAFT_186886 [Lasiosphaeria ovina]
MAAYHGHRTGPRSPCADNISDPQPSYQVQCGAVTAVKASCPYCTPSPSGCPGPHDIIGACVDERPAKTATDWPRQQRRIRGTCESAGSCPRLFRTVCMHSTRPQRLRWPASGPVSSIPHGEKLGTHLCVRLPQTTAEYLYKADADRNQLESIAQGSAQSRPWQLNWNQLTGLAVLMFMRRADFVGRQLEGTRLKRRDIGESQYIANCPPKAARSSPLLDDGLMRIADEFLPCCISPRDGMGLGSRFSQHARLSCLAANQLSALKHARY